MIKYYLFGIEFKNMFSASRLADYYRDIKDFEKMEKYLLLSIKFGFGFININILERHYNSNIIFFEVLHIENTEIPEVLQKIKSLKLY